MISKKKILSLLLLGSLLGAKTAAFAEVSFFEKVVKTWTDNQKDPSPVYKRAYDITIEQLEKIKKDLPKAVRMVLLSAVATLIGKFVIKALVKKPLEVAENSVSNIKNGLLKKMYISSAMSILTEQKSTENLLIKSIKNADSLSTSELIALYGLYLTYKSGQESISENLSNDATVNKMISDSNSIDREKLVELVLKERKKAREQIEEEMKKIKAEIENNSAVKKSKEVQQQEPANNTCEDNNAKDVKQPELASSAS